jgi:hypothetical protein
MKCQFCPDQECYIDDTMPQSHKVDLYQCDKCKAYYRTVAGKEDPILSVSWRVWVGKREYFIKSYDGCTGNAPEFVVSYHATNSEGHQYWEEVHRFNFVPKDWTPLNSDHKLKTYLPFL